MRSIFALLAIVALLGAAAWAVHSNFPLLEVAELAGTGGEKLLRDPMRPAGDGPRVVVIALDGVGDDELRLAISGGGVPTLQALVGREGDSGLYEHAYAVPGVLSILPSTTVAAWTSLFTGEPAGRTGVPGNEWFVREERKFYAPAPVSVTEIEHAVQIYTDDFVGAAIRVPTLYERAGVRSYVSLSQVHRGADLLTTPDLGVLGDLVAGLAEGVLSNDELADDVFARLDGAAAESLVESLRSHGVPELLVAYFPGVDLFTHVSEAPIPQQRIYLKEVIGPAVAAILGEYEAQGALEETYVLFVADHGHTPVLNDPHHSLGTDGEDDPPALIERTGFRMRPFVLEPEGDELDFQAAVAYQGAIAYVYLADRSSCPSPGQQCDWARPPRLEEDVLPVARAFFEANRTGAGAPGLEGTLDLVFAREPRPTTEDALPFQVWNGENLQPIGAYLAANPRPDLLDLERRLEGLAAGPYGHRAGDVLLLSRSGAARPIEDRFYFSAEYHSWHGSPSAQDSRIPLLVAQVGGSGVALRERVHRAVGDTPDQTAIRRLIEFLLETE